MQIRWWKLVIVLLAACAASGACMAAQDRVATANADAWIGHDAGDLLTQLRVDGGRVKIDEIESTGETSYTWTTENPAYKETRVTGSGGGMADQMNVFANPSLINVFAAPPSQTVQTKTVEHAATSRCQVTFFANVDGIVSHWKYDGPACKFDIEKPAR